MYPLMNRPDARLKSLSIRLSETDDLLIEMYPDLLSDSADLDEPTPGISLRWEAFYSEELFKENHELVHLYFSERNLLYYNPDFHHWLIGESAPALQKASEEFHRLKSHNPNHPLLKYFSEISDKKFVYSPDKKVQREFMIAYHHKFFLVDSLFHNYARDLRSISDEIEGIDRTPKQYELKEPVDLDEDLPF